MIRLRLIKGMSHTNAYVSATRKNPVVTVETEEAAAACVAGGFFEIIDNDASADTGKTRNATTPANAATVDAPPTVEAPDADMRDDDADDDDGLDSMTVAELRSYAETTGVDLDKLTKKADIIAAIRKAEAEE